MPVKIIIVILWTAGAVAIAYGMLMDNDPVFVIGMVKTIIGYIIFRRYFLKPREKQKQKK